MHYQLWYWDGLPGRGEFVRLALEAGGIAYDDCARQPGADLAADLQAERPHPPYAPPYLVAGQMTIAQTANILLFLGEKHGLAPATPSGRLWVNQLQLTVADVVAEAHDTHHPISMNAYYEDQKAPALARAQSFRNERLPAYLGYFERVLQSQGQWLAGPQCSYADLSLFQLVDGLCHAFPERMRTLAPSHPLVMALHRRVAALPALQAYFGSARRLPYGDGIFRHYPELDAA